MIVRPCSIQLNGGHKGLMDCVGWFYNFTSHSPATSVSRDTNDWQKIRTLNL